MSDARGEADELLSERPDLRNAVLTLLEIDAEPPWEFEDVPLDTGTFGELVSRGLVEKTDGGYVPVDRSRIQAALGGTRDHERASLVRKGGKTDRAWVNSLDARLSALVSHRVDLGCVLGALAVTVLARTVFHYSSVFRARDVVPAGNDPYLFVYWVERLLTEDAGGFDVGSLGRLPKSLSDHDLLLVIVVWPMSAILGGTTAVADTILAWYPVVASVFVGGFLYATATRLTADRRIGVATIAVFAVTPVAAYRTMIGFADHDALDFLWLSLTVLALILVVTRDEDPGYLSYRNASVVVAIGVGVTAQTLSWRGGPILLLPFGVALAVFVVSSLRTSASIGPPLATVAGGLVLASVLTMGVHFWFGWLSTHRAAVPVLLLGVVGGMGAFEAVVRQLSLPLRAAVGTITALAALTIGIVWAFVPPLSAGIKEFLEYMTIYTWSGIAETKSIFDVATGVFFSPFLLLGFTFVLGLGGLVAGSWLSYRRHSPGWLVLVVYGWFFLGMSIVQSRFAGQFALINSVAAGIGFVHLAAVVDVARPVRWVPAVESRARDPVRSISLPDRRAIASVGTLFLLVSSLGLVQTPVTQSQLAIDDERYQAARFVEDFAAERGMTYPENFVLSYWGRNRFYNYVVSGESYSYHYAQGRYVPFLRGTESGTWYERLRDRTGFVVTTAGNSRNVQEGSLQTRLHDNYGSRTDRAPAVRHYRAIYTSPDRSTTVFELVPGATVEGTGPRNETFLASTNVVLPPEGTEIAYEQRVTADENGTYRFVTPYPGTYRLGEGTVTVGERAVEQGTTVRVSNGTSR